MNVKINESLSLSFNTKETIKIVKEKKISYTFEKDAISQVKYLCFDVMAFDTFPAKIRVKYDFKNRFFGIQEINMLFTDTDSPMAFRNLEEYLTQSIGEAKYSDGTLNKVVYSYGEVYLEHSITESHPQSFVHQIRFLKKPGKNYIELSKIYEVKNMIDYYRPKDMKYEMFFYNTDYLVCILENDSLGYDLRYVNGSFVLTPYQIAKSMSNSSISHSHTPITERRATVKVKSVMEIKDCLKQYFMLDQFED